MEILFCARDTRLKPEEEDSIFHGNVGNQQQVKTQCHKPDDHNMYDHPRQMFNYQGIK
jgi:hypothetical protein